MKNDFTFSIQLLVSIILILLQLKGIAQNPGHLIFNTSNGLNSDEVYDVEIANNGHIWITTDRGVQSYDGFQFTNYSMYDGLQDNVNFEIFEDHNSNLWFNGYNGKVSIFSEGQFHGFKNNNQVLKILEENYYPWLSNIIISDSTVFLAGERYNVAQLFAMQDGTLKIINTVKTVELDGEKFKYINIGDYIFSYSKFRKDTEKLNSNVCVINDGRRIIINAFAVLIQDGNQNKVLKFRDPIEYINNEEMSKIWISTQRGLYSVDLHKNYEIRHYFEDYHITSINRDQEGNYWASTIESGLLCIPSFDFVTLDLSQFTIKNEKILSVGVLGDYLLAGTSGGRILAIDSTLKSQLIKQSNVYKDDISRLHNIGNNQLSSQFGIITYQNDQFEIEYPSMGYMSYLYKQKYKITHSNFGFSIHSDNEAVRYSQKFEDPILAKLTTVLIEDDFFLAGTYLGLHLTAGIDFDQTVELKYKGESIGRISDILKDKDDNIFILTMSNGLYFYKNEKLYPVETRKKIDFVNSGVFNGNILWLGTNKGLVKQEMVFSENGFEVINTKRYSIANGLISNFINHVTIWKNNIWLASNNGLCYFNTSNIDFKPAGVPLSINEVIINDTTRISKGDLLLHSQNNVKFKYRGISMKKDWISPFFKFRLEKNGNRMDWKNTDLNEMQFENLGPGSYKFEVNVQNFDKLWNKKPESFEFTINPHFTDRLWFRITTIIGILGSVILFFLHFIKKNKRRFLLRQKFKQIELDARESELSLLRNQMNPHFLFNALNSIQNLIFKKEDKKASQYIAIFGTLIRKTLDYTKESSISLNEELECARKYIELEIMRFPEKFDYSIHNEQNLNLDSLQIPPFLLQPIIENSIIHGFNKIDYKGHITITIEDISFQLYRVILTDNGKGFAKDQKRKSHKSIGLNLLSKRLELINQSLEKEIASIEFNENNGTEVIIKLPKQIA